MVEVRKTYTLQFALKVLRLQVSHIGIGVSVRDHFARRMLLILHETSCLGLLIGCFM